MSISEDMLKQIVKSVMNNVEKELGESPKPQPRTIPVTVLNEVTPVKESRDPSPVHQHVLGVFPDVDQAVHAAAGSQKEWVKRPVSERRVILEAMKQTVDSQKERYSELAVEETGLGNVADKIAKHELIITKTPGVEDLRTDAVSGDHGLTIEEDAPFGVIGAVTPVTNPTTTVIHNSLVMLAAGNAVVFNVHPSSKATCQRVVSDLNAAIKDAGGPQNLITMIAEPTLDTLNQLAGHQEIRLLVGTGGQGLVRSLLQSGKKAIGAGAGNPPVIVDETADIEAAAKAIILGASFDNNILCIAEKEVFALDVIYDDLIYHLLQEGAYMLSESELSQVMKTVLVGDAPIEAAKSCSVSVRPDLHIAKAWVGKEASAILKAATGKDLPVKLLICDVEATHPFVQLEQMMPVLPIVRMPDFDAAVEAAVKAEKGNRHTAVIHSKNVDRLTQFARRIETTIFVKNASSLAGVGFGGEGYATMTIAGPTGEGITSPRTFTRKRRCVLAEGGFRIIG
ncbi:aldehyde dehydrogenase family protein [Salisediminibacterium selenitireducens]|uniref:Aldehyde Dehydrogenase n=1 Tax=Bacillus selenitireducens (strain ATCC 700615 / DSM 15326 / MLS10) TaxID=439292 RepID=D6Y0N1_BACIE|nr:aldehyde dehydrogenase family protein [Salisediminibacterium selenitireducens]ADI00599.1 Aldehyde Dehydrogenase [[Bacillus] selenitireducens MLS10]